jgi:hypothetical protein
MSDFYSMLTADLPRNHVFYILLLRKHLAPCARNISYAYLWRLGLDLSGTSKGSVNFTHGCGIRVRQKGTSVVIVLGSVSVWQEKGLLALVAGFRGSGEARRKRIVFRRSARSRLC